MKLVTDLTARFGIRHVSSRWLSMRKACLRLLEQWPNLIEYFTKFLPLQKSFRPHLNSPRYKRIVEFIESPLSVASLTFIVYVAQDFERFLAQFQSNDPMIPYQYESLVSLLRSHMIKFVKKSVTSRFSSDISDGKQLIKIDVQKDHQGISKIKIGTKAKVVLQSENVPEDDSTTWRQKVLKFYQESTKYMQTNLPFENQILKDAAYLHPSKRTDPRSVNAVSHLSLTLIIECIGIHSKMIFGNKDSEDTCDMIRNQWRVYQLVDIPDEWLLAETGESIEDESLDLSRNNNTVLRVDRF